MCPARCSHPALWRTTARPTLSDYRNFPIRSIRKISARHAEASAGSHQPQHIDRVKRFEPWIAGYIYQGDTSDEYENQGLSYFHQGPSLPQPSVRTRGNSVSPSGRRTLLTYTRYLL